MAAISVIFLLLFPSLISTSMASSRRNYIVRMDPEVRPLSFATHDDWYSSTLSSADSLLYSYSAVFHGFAASLDSQQADLLRSSGSVLDIYEDPVYTLHTTRSPQFLGLDGKFGLGSGLLTKAFDEASKDVIIGVLDTGVWPELKSFSDVGMPAIPRKWKGKCERAIDFDPKLCNKKLIGARSFSRGASLRNPEDLFSPRDYDGHGTHTTTTAAGSHVANASLYGYAAGVARGVAAHSRVATYKVCWSSGCFGSDILAAIETAILDGVDVLSLSLGGGSAPYYIDPVAVGALAAVQRGIFVSCSAGNAGPTRSTVTNVAPWIMTVGAGTMDRDFPAYAILGNKRKFTGVSAYSGKRTGKRTTAGLVYDVGSKSSSHLCLPGSLDPARVRGKIVLCDRGTNARAEKGAVVRDAGGVGMILTNTEANGEELVADTHVLPALLVGKKAGDMIRKYVKSSRNPTAALVFGGTVVNVKPAPQVASFSSRGPNTVTPQIIKPDIIGPGVNILAGWTGAIGPTGLKREKRRSGFNIISGTSMSCPHISGLAALLKAAHPDWSPSAIKSALMTTAYNTDNTRSPLRDATDGSFSTPLAHGSGHVNPQKALFPGLVYDIATTDYVSFLCALGYTIDQVKLIVLSPNITCSYKLQDPGQLNYPSFSVVFQNKTVVRYTREVTNVDPHPAVYNVTVNTPSTVTMSVKPRTLTFKRKGEKGRYTVTFVSKKAFDPNALPQFGSITWSNAKYQVRSPIAFSWMH